MAFLPYSLNYDPERGPSAKPPKDLPRIPEKNFASLSDAADWAVGNKWPPAWLRVSEYTDQELDAFGLPEFVASCALDEAIEGEYESLA